MPRWQGRDSSSLNRTTITNTQAEGGTSAQMSAEWISLSRADWPPSAFPRVTDLAGRVTRESRGRMGIVVFLGLAASFSLVSGSKT